MVEVLRELAHRTLGREVHLANDVGPGRNISKCIFIQSVLETRRKVKQTDDVGSGEVRAAG